MINNLQSLHVFYAFDEWGMNYAKIYIHEWNGWKNNKFGWIRTGDSYVVFFKQNAISKMAHIVSVNDCKRDV